MQKIKDTEKGLQADYPKLEQKATEACKKVAIDIKRVLTEGTEYAETLSKTCQEFQGLFAPKAPVRSRRRSDDEDQDHEGMITPQLSPRNKARQLLAGLPLDWLDITLPSKSLEQEFEEFEQKQALGILGPLETLKIRAYIHLLLSEQPGTLAKELQLISQLEADMNSKMSDVYLIYHKPQMPDDNYVGFFLTTLSYYLSCRNKPIFYMHEAKLASLKAKFLDLQLAADQADIQSTNIPLMLNLSIRIGKICSAPNDLPLTSQFEVQKFPKMLLSELKGSLLAVYEVWQDYFIGNVNSKFEPVQPKSSGNPFNMFKKGITSLIQKKSSEQEELMKQVAGRKDYFKAALSEIGMMLGCLRVDPNKALQIVQRLATTFEIETSISESICRSLTAASSEHLEREAFKTVRSRRNDVLVMCQPPTDKLTTLCAIMPQVLPYLSLSDTARLLRLNKQVTERIGHKLRIGLSNCLTRQSLSAEDNGALYMRIINHRLQEFETPQRVLAEIASQGSCQPTTLSQRRSPIESAVDGHKAAV